MVLRKVGFVRVKFGCTRRTSYDRGTHIEHKLIVHFAEDIVGGKVWVLKVGGM